MKSLLISGNTLQEWNIEEVLINKTKDDYIARLIEDEWNDKMSKCGLTYGEIKEYEKYNYR